jgi:hypothetical protein
MTGNEKLVSAFLETLRRGRTIAAGTFALAMLLPTGSFAMDSKHQGTLDRAGYVLPLPSIRYLDSMRWMDWKPSAPVLKVDTLLLPDSTQPGVFRLPSDYEHDLPRAS